MNELDTVHRTDKTFLANVHEHFAHAMGQAVSEAAPVSKGGRPWTVRTVIPSEAKHFPQSCDATVVALRFEGNLSGEVHLCLSDEGAPLLAGAAADLEAPDNEARCLDLLSASREALIRALEPVFGAVVVHPPRIAEPVGRPPIAELRIQSAEGTEEAVVWIALDPALGASLERLAMATGALSAEASSARPPKDRERLDRVIDVPLAVTLRFGQRRMTLREVLALSTGSLVELDRQVEEPVELMLGARVVARGEVVIVEGNYGLRVLEVVEGTGTRAGFQAA